MFRRRSPSSDNLDQKNLKSKINKNLAHIVKELQKEYPVSSSPVLSESILAQHLCSVLESAFIHGLKSSYFEKDSSRSASKSSSYPKPQFWNLILKISHAETINRVEALPFITSKSGKCRAWLRLILNDGAVTSYLATILSKEQKSMISHYYESHAMFLDNEHADIFLRYLQGVESVVFELSFNSSILNQWTKTPLELAGLIPPSSSVPLYMQIQSKSENNNLSKPRFNNLRHRGSAPAALNLLRSGEFSKSLPVTSGDEWLRRNRESPREKENSPRLQKIIDEKEDEEDVPDTSTPAATPTEESVLHKRKLIKKRRKKSFNGLGKGVLGSWSSLSSDSGTSGSNGGGTNSARNTPRTRSFCETPPTAVLQRNNSEMSEKDLTPRQRSDESPEKRFLASHIPREDSDFAMRYSGNEKSTPRKNKNLVLTPKREKKGSESSDKTDGIEHFKSFPPEGPIEHNPSSGLEDSTSSQSSANIDSKLNSQMPLADNYKMSFVTSSSSGAEDQKVVPQGQSTPTPQTDVMTTSTDAIDIYSSSAREREDTLPPDTINLTFDFSVPPRVGNSLSRSGGWSAPNTPDFDQSTPKSAKSSGIGSSLGPNVMSSCEETPVEIQLASPEEFPGDFPTEQEEKTLDQDEIFIRREGYLKKMGEKFKQWKQRWFVLRGTSLSYFKDKKSEKPMGKIDLTGVQTISEETEEKGADIVIIMNDGTKHHLAAEKKEITLDWAADFRTVIAGLESQQKELEMAHDPEDIYSKNYLEEYEIISVPTQRLNGTNTSYHAAMIAHMGKIANEKGLDSQNYQCADCASPIGIIYGAPRVCNFTGQYYCTQCHTNDESQIPARIIHNWDFRKHKVSKRSKQFIEQVYADPLINLNEVNPGIYKYIDEMGKFLQLRKQLVHLKPYLQTCRNFDMEDLTTKLGSRLHFIDDCHLYSIQDMCCVNDKSVINTLSKIVNNGIKHVYGCTLCSAKGFLCEICNKNKIIFPFEIDSTVQCFECKSVYHRECKNDSCPKCERRQQRIMRAAAEKMKEIQHDSVDSD